MIYLLPQLLLLVLLVVLNFLVMWKAGFRSVLLLTCVSPIVGIALGYVRWLAVIGDNWFGLLFATFASSLVGLIPLFILAFRRWPVDLQSRRTTNMPTETAP